MRKLLILALLLGMSVSFTGAQREVPKRVFRVGVSVESDDESTESLTRLYTKIALHGLGDVEVVDGSVSDWQIHFMVMKTHDVAGVHVGYTMAVVFTRRYEVPKWALDSMLKPSVSDEQRKLWFEPVEKYLTIYLRTGAPDDLKVMCENVVANFDTDILDFYRILR